MPIERSDWIWLNGAFIPWDEASTHVLDHGLHYGTGVFEGIRAYATHNGRTAVFRLRDHVVRLRRSADAMRIRLPQGLPQLEAMIVETVVKNRLKECYIRPLGWYGFNELGLYTGNLPVNVLVAAWRWPRYLGEGGVRATISRWVRNHPRSFPSDAKICGGYVNSVLAVNDAKAAGYDEAIFLDHRGFVSEGSGENLFIVQAERLLTPPRTASILPGITRDTVITLARDAGFAVLEADITPRQLYAADEAFFTGTAAEVAPIHDVDDRTIGTGDTGPITAQLQDEYRAVTRGQRSQYAPWLTYIPES